MLRYVEEMNSDDSFQNVRQLNEALSCGGRQELGGRVVGRAEQGRSAHHVPAQAVDSSSSL